MKEVLDMYDWKAGFLECETYENSEDFIALLKGEIVIYRTLAKQNALMAKHDLISINEFNENEVRINSSIKHAMWVMKTLKK